MKNGMLIWNVILSLAIGYLLMMQFGSKKTTASAVKNAVSDTSLASRQFRMAYFEMDSVAANFDLVKDLKNQLTTKEDNINAEMTSRSKKIQEKYNYYQDLAKSGKLSETQSEAASKELKEMDDEMKNRKQQLDQEYNNYMMTTQNEIKTKIESFIKEYNKTKNYSYIISYEQGLFYYRDTAFNITTDVVKGLNEFYKQPKKK